MEIDTNKKYKLIKRIGEGASGKAYLVENIIDKTLCVIKTIYIDLMNDEEKKEAFIEATILEKLEHPNIVKFKETFMMKKPKHSLCIVMEYADGGDLKSKIALQKDKYFEENNILDWFTQICLALKHIHDRKILHRDLKSQNIFLSKNGLVKLGDFGIAKCLNYTLDKANTYIGTPYYLSPEIVQNMDYSFKSDIWSLGVLLYEMICLKVPFEANNLATLSLKIIKGSYNPIPSHFSKELRNLLAALLSVDHLKRPNINNILKYPVIKSRIKNFLNEVDYSSEFSHTILHNFHPLKRISNPISSVKQNPASEKTVNNNKDIIIINREKRVFSHAQAKKPIIKENSIKTNSNFNKKSDNFPLKSSIFNKNKESSPTRFLKVKESSPNRISDVRSSISKDTNRGNETSKVITINEKTGNVDKSRASVKTNIKKSVSNNNNVVIDLTKVVDKCASIRASDSNKSNNSNDHSKTPTKNTIKHKTHSSELVNKEAKIEEDKNVNKKDQGGVLKLSEMLKSMNKKYKRSNIKSSNSKENNAKQRNPFTVAAMTTNSESIIVTDENNDIKDYVNSHKMLVEMDEIQSGEVIDKPSEINLKPEINKENLNINDVLKDEGYIDTKNEQLKTEEPESNDKEENCDFSQIEAVKIELEAILGQNLLSKVFKIVDDSIPFNSICYNHEVISKTFIKELMNNIDSSLVLICIDKIPEIFSLVIKERELQIKNKVV